MPKVTKIGPKPGKLSEEVHGTSGKGLSRGAGLGSAKWVPRVGKVRQRLRYPQIKACLPPREVRGLDLRFPPFSIPHWSLCSLSLAGTALSSEHLNFPGKSGWRLVGTGPEPPSAPRCERILRHRFRQNAEGSSHPKSI